MRRWFVRKPTSQLFTWRPMRIASKACAWQTRSIRAQTRHRPRKSKGLPTGNPLICMVRLAGFEPTTPWFVAKYSIQLSYSR